MKKAFFLKLFIVQDKYNGDINTQAQYGDRLAHFAINENQLDRLAYFIRININLEIKSNYGYSVFMQSIVIYNNLNLCKNLFGHGCNINTQDIRGNTPLLNILHAQNNNYEYKREKFYFLLENGCDIDIQNIDKEYPISVCIINNLNEEAGILLDKGAKIIDNDSYNEPIANALKIGSQYWFEKLGKSGANATNTVFPVLATYIKSYFFDFEIMKSISSVYLHIGGLSSN